MKYGYKYCVEKIERKLNFLIILCIGFYKFEWN